MSHSEITSNSQAWESLNAEVRHHVKYPAETVVRFVKKNFKKGSKILDDGCGAGRHVCMLAEEGYRPSGIDITESGIAVTKRLLEPYFKPNYIKTNIKQASCDSLPFATGCFDGVISYGVLYYMDDDAIQRAIDEIYRVLKPNGKMMLHIRTLEDYRYNPNNIDDTCVVYQHGKDCLPHECFIEEGDTSKSANKEKGMKMHFFDRKEIECRCYRFADLEINTEKIYHDNDSYADVNFIVEGRKPLGEVRNGF